MHVVDRRTPSFKIKRERESADFSRDFKEAGTALTRASITTLNVEQSGNKTKLEAGREK